MKSIGKTLMVSLIAGTITLGGYKVFLEQPQVERIIERETTPIRRTSLSSTDPLSFVEAAEKSVNSVVHVTTSVETKGYVTQSPLDFFFGNPGRAMPPQIREGSGSGVIISKDGYIVTNNHVIEKAQKIKIKLNNDKQYDAVVIGTDPNTDIGLLKIESDVELPYLTFSNSDDVRLGEWVLAVGNPFNLTSTVTAGIVSAKSRNIGIIDQRSAIESFIQTDAAVNPGNSGGALVNTRGELIGINSAISTHTGSFEGYSFAVPANIVQKVVKDLLEFGAVQRAFIGVNISDVNPAMAEQLDIELSSGVYVGGVTDKGAAEKAGIETGDVIIAINGKVVNKSSELQEIIGGKRPGDRVKVTVNRKGKELNFDLELRNMNGNTASIKASSTDFMSMLGADLEPLSEVEKSKYGIRFGLKVEDLSSGILKQQGIPEGFIITHINRKAIQQVSDVNNAVKGMSKGDPVVLQGYTSQGRTKYFAFGF